MLWTDNTLQETYKYTLVYKRKHGSEYECNWNCRCCPRKEEQRTTCDCCCVSVKPVKFDIKGQSYVEFSEVIFSRQVVLVVSVLVDGDWYVCCWSEKEQSQLACKDKKTKKTNHHS